MSFDQVLYILWQRRGVIGFSFASVLIGAVLTMLLVPARYDAVATASIDASALDPVANTQLSGPATALMLMQGNLVALAKSNQVALEVVKRTNLASVPDLVKEYRSSKDSAIVDVNQWIANQIVQNVDAKFGDKSIGASTSNVLNLTYKSRDPRDSATMANAFLGAFIDAAIAMKAAFAQQSADWFNPQIDKLRGDLAKTKRALADFQVQNNLVGPTANADAESDQLTAVTAELSKTRAELVSLKSLYAGAPAAVTESNDAQTVDQQTLTALRSNLSLVEAEITKLQREIGSNNPKLQERLSTKRSLKDQIDTLIAENRRRLAERIAAHEDKIASLEKARAAQVKSMIDVQNKREQLAVLKLDVETRQAELERASHAATQARMQGQYSFSNITILDKATPPTEAAFPKLIIVGPVALIAGLLLGLTSALFAEVFDRRIRASADLDFVTEAPVLGTLVNTRETRKPSRADPTIRRRLGGLAKFVQRLSLGGAVRGRAAGAD